MLEVDSTFAYPLANMLRCALNVTKTGVVALHTGSLVSIPGLNLNPHELMGYLINLSFAPVSSLQSKFVSLSTTDKTLGHIVNKLGVELVDEEIVDLDTPIIVVTETVQFTVIIGSHTYFNPLDKETVEDFALNNGLDIDTLILSTFPLYQKNTFPYTVQSVGGNKSLISFQNVSESVISTLLNTLSNLSKK